MLKMVHSRKVPLAAVAYDGLAEKWDTLYVDRRAVGEDKFTYGMIRGLLSGGSVLDVACGTGALLNHVSIPQASYLGLDISEGMVAAARKKHPGYLFVRGTMTDINGVAAYGMDAVLSPYCGFSYLTAAEDCVAAAREFHRVLKPGGVLMVMVCGPKSDVKNAYQVVVDGEVVPRHSWTAAAFKSLFEGVGFRQVRVRGLSFLADLLPEWTPQWVFNQWIRLEAAVLGRLVPDRGYFLYVTARK